MYWTKDISNGARLLTKHWKGSSRGASLVAFCAQMSAMAAILQSAGGFLPVIGYLISPLATAPVMLSALFSFRAGVITYFSTMILLLIIQPSELLLFPLTTGLLGIVLGTGIIRLRTRIRVALFASIALFAGINILLYIFHFPVLGPLSWSSGYAAVIGVYLFTFFYSWLWVEVCILIIKKVWKGSGTG